MKNFINKFKWFILGGIVFLTPTIYAVSQPSFTPSLVPLTDGIYNLGTTSPSNLRWNKLFLNNLYLYGISDGCLYTSSNLVTSTGAACGSGGGGGSNSFAWPFDVSTNYVSTSSKPVGFLNGLFSTASSTFSSNLYLSNLSQGLLFNGSFGLTKTVATTTLAGTGLISVSNSPVVIGASGAVISCSTCVADSRSVSAGTGLNGGGDLSSDRTINLTVPVVVSSGGTNATSFAGNSIITSNSAGTGLIATTSQLTVGSLIATSTDKSFFMGNVGISTTTPNWPLQIQSGTQPQLVLTDPNAASGIKHVVFRSASGYVYIDKASDTTFATTSLGPKITFDTNGNGSGKIGIGTTTPTQSLSIQGPIGGGSSVGVNLFSDSTDGGKKVGSYTQELSLGNRFGQIKLWSEDTQGLSLTGNILQRSYILPLAFGVGTDTPASRLSVWGAATDANIFEAVNVASTTFLKVSNTGFGTTTVSGLTISGSATSTSNVGFNLTTGCYAISNTCISGSAGGGSGTVSSGLAGQLGYFSSTGTTIVGTSTNPLYVDSLVATSTTGWTILLNDGVGIGTTSPTSPFLLNVSTTTTSQLSLAAGAGIPQWTFRSVGGNLYISTSTVAGTATTSVAALSLLNTGEVIIRNLFQVISTASTKLLDVVGNVVTLLGTWDFTSATLKIPTAADPTVNANGIMALNTTLASTSIRVHDGTSERALYATYDKSFNMASSSMAYDGVTATASSTVYVMANSFRPQTLMSLFCKTKSGTVWLDYGNGTASSTVNCTTTGASSSANPTFIMRQDQYMQIGKTTGTLGDLTITATFRNDAD